LSDLFHHLNEPDIQTIAGLSTTRTNILVRTFWRNTALILIFRLRGSVTPRFSAGWIFRNFLLLLMVKKVDSILGILHLFLTPGAMKLKSDRQHVRTRAIRVLSHPS